ncbi:MAG TPA: branched-chain amino acid ABC transporter permease, partial [Burkholderiales bacterium]|nr:branched-chain amino acid ABC transporter permease [Burkholderiales bacterium]
MDAFFLQVLSGLATGGIYASLALAVVMIYKATHEVNFAQGEMAMFSTYVAWQLIQWGMPYWGAFFLTIAISFVGGVAIERTVIRPFEAREAVLAVVTVFIGLFLILNS